MEAVDGIPVIGMPSQEAGEPSVEELAEGMTEKEFRALVIMSFRYVRDIHKFCMDLQETMLAINEKGGMMSKMMGGFSVPAPPPPPAKLRQEHPHTSNGRRR